MPAVSRTFPSEAHHALRPMIQGTVETLNGRLLRSSKTDLTCETREISDLNFDSHSRLSAPRFCAIPPDLLSRPSIPSYNLRSFVTVEVAGHCLSLLMSNLQTAFSPSDRFSRFPEPVTRLCLDQVSI